MYLGLALLIEGLTGVGLVFLPPAVEETPLPGAATLNHHCVDDLLHVRWEPEGCSPHPELASLNVTLPECRLSCQQRNETELTLGELHCPSGDDR